MADVNVEEWLANWIEENLKSPQYYSSPEDMGGEAASCRADALQAGITTNALNEAAGGNLEAYLLDAQNRLTDDEVRRLAED